MSPDTRKHRGAHPADAALFGADQLTALRTATAELSWLLTRDYQTASGLKLVGDRHGLTARQRLAISRAACSDQSRERRSRHSISMGDVAERSLIIDGFNLLITVEAALSGGVLIVCRDNCIRDLSGVHGSYRSVQETEPAIRLIGVTLEKARPARVQWLFDRPISNSGRLARKVIGLAEQYHWPWSAKVVFNPDREILSSGATAITSDSAILDRTESWVGVGAYLVQHQLKDSWLLDLRETQEGS